AVLAMRQIPAAYSGWKPNPTNIAAEIATGAPNPAAPSRKAPKENAINNACNRRSGVIDAIKLRMTSNCPPSTVRLKRYTAVIMIQDIGNRPYSAPCTPERSARSKGIRYTTTASTIANARVSRLARYPFIFLYSAVKMNTIGMEATRGERTMLSKGSMVWVHCISVDYVAEAGCTRTTSTQCFGFTPVKCSIWWRQLNPLATTTVPSFRDLTEGKSMASPIFSDNA